MKIKVEIKSRLTGDVLFELKKENNTIKNTLEEAVRNGANLLGADLRVADLGGANLRYANLRYANLRGANLHDADLYGADLGGVDLHGANLGGAYLYDADLGGVDLRDAKKFPFIPFACPSDGAFIGWKKVKGRLVKLEIPEDARRSSATTSKCRCDKAKVLAITDYDGSNPIDEIINDLYCKTIYKVGERVYPDSFDENRWSECSNGIHFFINKQDAIDY